MRYRMSGFGRVVAVVHSESSEFGVELRMWAAPIYTTPKKCISNSSGFYVISLVERPPVGSHKFQRANTPSSRASGLGFGLTA